ncbi:hypothetical protein, partial [Niallia circulans]
SIILCLKSGYRPSSLTGQFFSALISETTETLQAMGRSGSARAPRKAKCIQAAGDYHKPSFYMNKKPKQ